MTEFFKGSVSCVIGQTTYQITHPKINDPLSFPFVSLSLPLSSSSPLLIKGITNKTTVSFDVILDTAPVSSGYAINWQINIPGTDVSEYVNDKRYYSKEEVGNAKLARIHWKNIIAAPDMTAEGLKNNHNHNDRYWTKSETVPVIDARITQVGSFGPLANTIVVRDAHGRTQVNTPIVNAGVANKGYVDVKISGEASSRLATDLILQSKITSISGSYAPLSETQYLQSQINMLEALVMNISGTGFYSGGSVPVGTIIWQASSLSLGLDWGYANGSSHAISAYPDLFARIGYTFGGSGTVFSFPELRGEFFRGWDDGRGIDAGRIFGTSQTDDNKAHTHTTSVNSAGDHDHTITATAVGGHIHGLNVTLLSNAGTGGASGTNVSSFVGDASTTQSAGAHTHAVSATNAGNHSHSVTVNSTGTESRPRNVALKPFIKLYTPIQIEPVNITGTQGISGQKTFNEAIVVPLLPQAIIFGNPSSIGTKALGVIGGNVAITIQSAPGVWTPVAWLG